MTKIIIATEGWTKEEINDLTQIFPKEFPIIQKNLAQFVSDVEVGIVITFIVSGVVGGLSGKIGSDIWDKLKEKFSQKSKEDKNTSIGLEIIDGEKVRKLSLKTENPDLIQKAFDTISEVLKNDKNEKEVKHHFDEEKMSWIKVEESEFIKTVTGVGATTKPVKKGNKIYQMSLETLQKYAHTFVGKPITIGHGGKEIGKITKSWVEDDKLYYEGGIYKTASQEDILKFENIVKNGGGVSIAYSYFDTQ